MRQELTLTDFQRFYDMYGLASPGIGIINDEDWNDLWNKISPIGHATMCSGLSPHYQIFMMPISGFWFNGMLFFKRSDVVDLVDKEIPRKDQEVNS